ncbi:hypothetical protein AMAG_00680 [Allomyces macrogynus ATCC 38327]|uniref:Chromo domain-containing protein n=1 Tax=Allomyces macrogynus (strain ATCC 38327) TaxID=578462 RepID=A0A0L0RXD4_ALLM3|nr:hypothetical protein AMAG_00680 [Allomyces macrogynus ATCC 38327]|eukprot:KNE54721.1 hypothetical protein AMAG_00680 [Allomyces macrogynus ATCC 38327]
MSSRNTKVPQVEEVRRPISDDESDDGEEEFEVEKILDHKAKKDGQMMYYLKWKGYAIDDATWEDTDCLTSCEDLLRDYWAKKGCNINGRPLKTGSMAAAPGREQEARCCRRGVLVGGGPFFLPPAAAPVPVTPSPTTPDPAAAPYDFPDDENGVDGVGDDAALLPPGEVYAPMDMVHEQKLDPNLASWEDLVEDILTLDVDPTSKQPYVYLKLKSGEHAWARVLTSVARYKIPQKLIDFYESRLTFKYLEEPATQDEVEDEAEPA